MDTWPQSISEAYSEIDRWIPTKYSDPHRSKPTAFVATAGKDAPWLKSPCNECGKLGHWKKDFPDAKDFAKSDAKPEEARSQEPSTNAPKKKKRDHCANLSVQLAIDKLTNNNEIFHLLQLS